MDEARKLLDETSLAIHAVGKSVGYPDYFAFAKVFRQKTGCSPKDYRNRFYNKTNKNLTKN